MSGNKTNELTKEALSAWAENASIEQLVEWEQTLELKRRQKRDDLRECVVDAIALVLYEEAAQINAFNWDQLATAVQSRLDKIRSMTK